jgi:hypothetical protein
LSNSGWHAHPYRPGDQHEWDSLVAESRAPHFLFYRRYMDYHADRFEDASLLLYENDTLMTLLPANRDGDSVRSHGGLTFGGFIADSRMTSHKMLGAMQAALASYRESDLKCLVYSPVPHIYHASPAEEDLYAVFRNGGRLIRRDLSSVIALRRRVRPSKGRQAGIRRVGATDLEFAQSTDWVAFMELEQAVLRERYDVTPTHAPEELTLLASRFPGQIRLFVATRGAQLLGGIVVYETPVVAHAQYIGVSDEGRALGALDFLVSRLLDKVYADKTYFDFGISTEHDGADLNAGLVRNKESFGARAVSYDRYEIAL